MIIATVYVVLCVIIALIGIQRKFGFWGYFFCSLFLTPVIGAIIVLASDERPQAPQRCPRCSYPLTEARTERPAEKCLPQGQDTAS